MKLGRCAPAGAFRVSGFGRPGLGTRVKVRETCQCLFARKRSAILTTKVFLHIIYICMCIYVYIYIYIWGGTQDKKMSKSLSTLRLEGSPTQSRTSPSIQRILRISEGFGRTPGWWRRGQGVCLGEMSHAPRPRVPSWLLLHIYICIYIYIYIYIIFVYKHIHIHIHIYTYT